MAISSMQQPRQMQKGLGSLRDPRQKYGFGSFVKKFTRPLKKVLKSPLGKAALLGGATYFGLGGGNPFTAAGRGGFGNNAIGKYLLESVLFLKKMIRNFNHK